MLRVIVGLIILIVSIFYFKSFSNDDIKINIIMKVEESSPRMREKSILELNKISKSSHGQKTDYVLGLYAVDVGVEVDSAMDVGRSMFGDGLLPKAVEIKIDVSHSPTIWIASELNGYTCSRKVILDHEMMHHKIALDGLRDMKEKIELRLKNKYLKRKKFNNDDDVSEFLDNLTLELKDEVVKFIEVDIRHAQQDLDTEEEYDRISNECDGAIQQIIGKSIFSY